MNILFCDDEPDILEIYNMEFGFHAPEHNYFKAESPEKAYEICKNLPIDVIFTDYKMPTMSGLQLLQKLRKDNISPKKAYIITGFNREHERNPEILQFADKVFSKPPNFQKLCELVHEIKRATI